MRRLLVLLLIVSICMSLVACGSGSTAPQTAPEDETPDTAATSDTASSTGINSSAEVEEKELTLEDWFAENPDVQANYSSSGTEVSADGNDLLLKYDLSTDGVTKETAKSDVLKQSIVESLTDSEGTFVSIVKELEKQSGIPDITLTILYTCEDEPVVSVMFTRDGISERPEETKEVESLFGVYVLVEGEGVSGSDQTFLEATKLQELPGIKIIVIENDAADITAHFYYYDEGKRIVYTGLQDGITKISTPYSTVIGIRGNTIVLDGTEWELGGDRIIREGEGYREVYERNDDIDLTEASFEMYVVGRGPA